VNVQQKTALAYPCYFGFETAQRRYGWVLSPRDQTSLVLTVNTGYE